MALMGDGPDLRLSTLQSRKDDVYLEPEACVTTIAKAYIHTLDGAKG